MVNDDERVLRIMETVLKQFGFGVWTAPGGPEALALLPAIRFMPDVAVIDLVMPRMTGREIIQRVRKIRPSLPIISTTGYVCPLNSHSKKWSVFASHLPHANSCDGFTMP